MIRWARRRGVPLIIPRGDITAREQRLLTAAEGGMDEEERTRAKERSDAAEKTMTERGDERGAAPYGWSRQKTEDGRIVKVLTDPDKPARVVAIFREHGSYNATARKLNDDGVPPPSVPKNRQRRGSAGPPMWSAATVRDIIQREAPDLAKKVSATPRTKRSFLLRGLLRCHCGAPMTPSYHPRGTEYYCNRGKRGAHRPYTIAERKVLPWVEDEAAHYRYERFWEADAEERAIDTADKRRRLEAARDLMSEDAYGEALAAIEAGEGRPERVPVEAPPYDPEWSIEARNKWLRAAFEYVQLGPDLRPVEAVWTVPEWRA